jgi:hypothetical protein
MLLVPAPTRSKVMGDGANLRPLSDPNLLQSRPWSGHYLSEFGRNKGWCRCWCVVAATATAVGLAIAAAVAAVSAAVAPVADEGLLVNIK